MLFEDTFHEPDVCPQTSSGCSQSTTLRRKTQPTFGPQSRSLYCKWSLNHNMQCRLEVPEIYLAYLITREAVFFSSNPTIEGSVAPDGSMALTKINELALTTLLLLQTHTLILHPLHKVEVSFYSTKSLSFCTFRVFSKGTNLSSQQLCRPMHPLFQ